MTRRRHTKKDRARIFEANDGRCYLCGGKIDGVRERWDIEHVVPWELTRDDSDENLRPAHVSCHKVKTADDIRAIRKSDRVKAKHNGSWARPRRSFQTNRDGPFKAKVGGGVVRRNA